MWAQQLANGLTTGVVYALMGMGFSMVWATARTMNFAYGVTYTLGAYVFIIVFPALAGGGALSIPILAIALVVVAIVGAVLGYLLDLSLFRPVRNSEIAPYFTSFGAAIALETVYGYVFGLHPQVLRIEGAREFYEIGPVTITPVQVIVLAASIAIMVALHLVTTRTSFGRAMRAIASDRPTALLMGVSVDRVIVLVFVVSSIIAMWAGAFVALFYGIASPYMGSSVLLKGLAAAVLGGFGNIPGAVVGGLLLGVLEAIGAGLTTSGNWPSVLAYSVLVVVILIRPRGILPERAS